MTDHIEKPRIVGEFYIAEHHWYDTPENEWYLIHRIGDKYMDTVLQVAPHKNRHGYPYGLEERTKHELEKLDEQARHWIEHTQAQIQEVREAARSTSNKRRCDWCPNPATVHGPSFERLKATGSFKQIHLCGECFQELEASQ